MSAVLCSVVTLACSQDMTREERATHSSLNPDYATWRASSIQLEEDDPARVPPFTACYRKHFTLPADPRKAEFSFLVTSGKPYWIKANERAIALGQRLLGERFLLLRFDDLCRTPRPEVEKLIDFLGVDGDRVDMERLVGSPKVPATMGRYREKDLGVFDRAEIEAVRRLGFVVEG